MTNQVSHRTDQSILYIGLHGRIDASNAPAVEADIAAIRAAEPGKTTVLDAEELTYISSAGLRIVLRLRKEEPQLAVINTSPEVYEIFDMTGFTDMITVKKAFRRLSVEGCEVIGKGANGAVYRYDAETIVKVYHNPDSLPEIQRERELARKAFVLGVNTAMPYDIVRIGNGYGTVAELLNAVSLSKMIKADPQHLETPAKYYVDTLRQIHGTVLKPGEMPDMKETAAGWAAFVEPHLPAAQGRKLKELIAAVPERCNMLHGDYHTNNIMVRDGESLLIDMDTLCMGHPIFELGSMFNAFIGFAESNHEVSMQFLGFPFETAAKFWRLSLAMYLGTEDEAVVCSVEEKAMIVGYTRMLRRSIRRNEPESPARIARSKEQLAALLAKVDSLDF